MSIDEKTVRKVAKLARLALPEERVKPMAAELNGIMAWIEQLNEVDIDGVAPMTSDFVACFKDTSIASMIAVVELNKEYQILAKSSLKFFEIGLITAAIYLLLSIPLGYLSRYLEAKWSTQEK